MLYFLFPNFLYAEEAINLDDSISKIFAGMSLLDSAIWLRMLLLCSYSLVIYVIGTFMFEKNKKS